MAQITVRQIPDEVHRALKAKAKQECVSAEAKARQILAEGLFPADQPPVGKSLRARPRTGSRYGGRRVPPRPFRYRRSQLRMIILDTNVVLEIQKQNVNPNVETWFDRQVLASLWLTTIVVAELRYGAALLDPGKERMAFERLVAAYIDDIVRGPHLCLRSFQHKPPCRPCCQGQEKWQ
jgi:plasmid stability protein